MALETITLLSLRDQAKDMADMQNTTFVSDTEWDRYINQGVRELYDLLLEAHGQEYFLKTFEITLTPPTNVYTLPDDLHAVKGVDFSTTSFPDLSEAAPAFGTTRWDVIDSHIGDTDAVEILPYMFADRHSPTTSTHVYGNRVHRFMRYRTFAEEREQYFDDPDSGPMWIADGWFNRIRFDPIEAGYALIWYVPQAPLLSSDTDVYPHWHGFQLYPALFAAQIALDKEETDSTPVAGRLSRMKDRLYRMAAARDAGHAEQVQNTFYEDY